LHTQGSEVFSDYKKPEVELFKENLSRKKRGSLEIDVSFD
jgi:hypothetical protein